MGQQLRITLMLGKDIDIDPSMAYDVTEQPKKLQIRSKITGPSRTYRSFSTTLSLFPDSR